MPAVPFFLCGLRQSRSVLLVVCAPRDSSTAAEEVSLEEEGHVWAVADADQSIAASSTRRRRRTQLRYMAGTTVAEAGAAIRTHGQRLFFRCAYPARLLPFPSPALPSMRPPMLLLQAAALLGLRPLHLLPLPPPAHPPCYQIGRAHV